jgi:hypothetical protein
MNRDLAQTLTPTAAKLALIACTALGLASCGSAGAARTGAGTSRVAAASAEAAPHGRATCPLGRLLPAGTGEAVDYIDFLRLGGRSYDAVAGHIAPRQLGPVITHIRCSLTAEEDQRRSAPPVTDRTAAFLPVGARVYQVHGYSAACRVAAYGPQGLTVYLAQVQHGSATPAPLPCATASPR